MYLSGKECHSAPKNRLHCYYSLYLYYSSINLAVKCCEILPKDTRLSSHSDFEWVCMVLEVTSLCHCRLMGNIGLICVFTHRHQWDLQCFFQTAVKFIREHIKVFAERVCVQYMLRSWFIMADESRLLFFLLIEPIRSTQKLLKASAVGMLSLSLQSNGVFHYECIVGAFPACITPVCERKWQIQILQAL